MAGRDCIKRLIEASDGVLNRDAAKEILDTIEREARKSEREGFDYDDEVSKIVAERMENTKANLAKEKANIARNMVIKARGNARIGGLVEANLSVYDAFRAELEGINSPIAGARDSLEVQQGRTESVYFSSFLGELNKEGLLPLFNSHKLDDEISKELWALSYKEEGVTQNKQAKRIAEIAFKTLDGQRQRLNAAGADIGELGGYMTTQRHNIEKMIKLREDGWVAKMLPLVDEKRSFAGDYDNLEDALRGAYKVLTTGIRLDDPLAVKDAKLFQFSGPANLGKKLSQSRQIHFKDHASWKTWHEELGMKDLNEGIADTMRFNANNIALLERYGTNPEAMLKEIAKDTAKKYRDRVVKEGEQALNTKLDNLIDNALGKNQHPASPRLARIGGNIRLYQNLRLLGRVLLASVGDIPFKSLEYKYQGKNWLSSFSQPFLDVAQGFKSKKDRVNFASQMGVYLESMVGDIAGRFSVQDSLSNKAVKVQRMFFKMNGLAWWTDTHKFAMQRTMAHDLGLKKDTAFDKLDDDTKRLFGNYNITDKDWNAMREAAVEAEDGRAYILADEIKNQKVREKLVGYFIDRTESGVLTPGMRERRLVTLGARSGTPAGEVVRQMMQFKSFPVSVVTKVWGRALYGKGKADVPAMAYLMLNMMLFGYLAESLYDLTKGRTPKDPTNPETMFAVLARSGGLGIAGDLLFQDYGFGRSLADVMAGPTVSQMSEVWRIYSEGVRGGGSARQALMTGVGAVPFNNLFYARPALDHILLMQIQEDLNPGYLRRMEKNMKKTYGQELLYR